MLKEFRKFALKGNVLDLAIAVVIGAAFGKIVTSLVENIITPLVGTLLYGVDFTTLSLPLRGDAKLEYGIFIQSIFDFLIISFSIFLFIRLLMKFKRKSDEEVEEKEETINQQEVLLTEIRDLLKSQNNNRDNQA